MCIRDRDLAMAVVKAITKKEAFKAQNKKEALKAQTKDALKAQRKNGSVEEKEALKAQKKVFGARESLQSDVPLQHAVQG